MRQAVWLVAVVWVLAFGRAALAQDTWVQIEAQPSLAEAEERARAYAGVFPNVAGFALSTGWYGIMIGPFPPAEAERQLGVLRRERMIPPDSYIADPDLFRQRFWPVGAAALGVPPDEAGAIEGPAPLSDGGDPALAAPDPLTLSEPVPEPAPEPLPEPDETPREARASEADLAADERELIQTALQWEGFYTGRIDGAFGPGTRNAMAAWQAAAGLEETGILTTRQRAALVTAYREELAALGLQLVREQEAGIEVQLPTKLVSFDHYEPPFVHYNAVDGSGFRVLLISQQGDEDTLAGLYDIMQTLEIVPLEGERELSRQSFVLTGKNGTVQSYTQAELQGGLIKGFTLAWRPEDGDRAVKVLEAMKATFRPFGDRALDDSLGAPLAEEKVGLMAGLEVRRPLLSRSGFYIDPAGQVLTTTEVLKNCGRLTFNGTVEADVAFADNALGLAVLKPRTALAPRVTAELEVVPPRLNSEVAVAGYSYEDRLDAPVVTFGRLAEMQGLDGEASHARLALSALPGDAGGPVLDASGAVLGLLLPREAGTGRVLPEDVAHAVDADAIADFLAANGVTPAASARQGSMAAEDLARTATAMTVLVSCWE